MEDFERAEEIAPAVDREKNPFSPENPEQAVFLLQVSEQISRGYEALIHSLEEERNDLAAEVKRLEQQLRTDSLTGVQSEFGFRETMERRKTELGAGLVLMYLDVNKFKSINDTLGHEAGDFIIKEVAKYLRTLVRENDVVARPHGDEFIIVFSGISEDAIAQRFENTKLSFTAHYHGQEIPVTLSAGIATHVPGNPVEVAMNQADAAMYISKRDRAGTVARLNG